MRFFILILALAFSAPVFSQAQGTPAGRFKAVIDNLRNADTSNAQLTRISDRLLVRAAPNQDTSGWTSAQKATAVLAFLRSEMKSDVANATRIAEHAVAATTIEATAATAAADID